MFCKKSFVRKRKDLRDNVHVRIVKDWLIGNNNAKEIAHLKRIGSRTLHTWCDDMYINNYEHIPFCLASVIIVDATSIGPDLLVLVARTTEYVLGWIFIQRENTEAYMRLLKNVYGVGICVMDGQKGGIAAVKHLHPHTRIQRCMIHVIRQVKSLLTQNPQTTCGQILLNLIRDLPSIRTRRQKRRWLRKYHAWRGNTWKFLSERSYSPDRKHYWYTHKNLRRSRTHMDNAIPDLFRYLAHQDKVPRTSNHVEGGINSRLKELINRHRGLSVKNKMLLVSMFLGRKMMEKPTQIGN